MFVHRKIFMKIKILLYSFLACLVSYSYGQALTSIELQPTVAYLKYKGAESRMVRLLFHGGNSYSPGKVWLSFNGVQDSVEVPAGLSYFELPVPGAPVKEDTQLSVRYQSNGVVYTARCIVSPTRKWSVYIMPHSHVDVGYTNVQEKVLAIHMNNIDEAIRIGQHSADYPVEARFKWNTEAIWVVDNYLARASEEKKRIFWDAVKKGWINLDGAYGNINTSATSPAQLMHMFATGTRLAKEHGMQVQSMFQGDVPGSSWGLASQTDITGIKYFLSAPNASDRIGTADSWRDKPFYWASPSGKQKLLFWQSSPYSIGYALKGSKIPNFFTIEDPKPFYTGTPSENFLNPYLFNYLAKLDQKSFPYDMTLLTWAMSDNAPIDPELPDAVKAWNEHYASPRLVITSVKQFFQDFEAAYKDKIPVVSGDYTEYWTDGIASAARETGINRNASDHLQQAAAIWAIHDQRHYPAADFDKAWTNIVMFNEHTWGAYNSVSQPEDPKAVSQWNYKQAFALNGKAEADSLLKAGAGGNKSALGTTAGVRESAVIPNAVDVYNTLAIERSGLVLIPAAQSSAGDLVKDSKGKKVPSQRLSTGELAVVLQQFPAYSKQRLTIEKGNAYTSSKATVKNNSLQNGIYAIALDTKTGNIIQLQKNGRNLADSTGLNQYTYLPGDSLDKIQYTGEATITVKEKGPLVVSLLVSSTAPGANSLTREIRLTADIDNIELINTIDKKAIGTKESVHFAFPFRVPAAQVRYNIPWGSINAEADQLKYANRNWYTMQRWVDVSNKDFGITWSSPDAPLFEIGQYTTGGLLGSLDDPNDWLQFTEQQPVISSWVMNNLWHTNFRRDQEGVTTFRYYMQVHNAYNADQANRYGLENHQPLVVTAAAGPATESLFFSIDAKNVYVENINPARDGMGVLLQLVNVQDEPVTVTLKGKEKLRVWESNLLEEDKTTLNNTFDIPGKGVIMIRVATN
jgi:alpha-mannosidase